MYRLILILAILLDNIKVCDTGKVCSNIWSVDNSGIIFSNSPMLYILIAEALLTSTQNIDLMGASNECPKHRFL